jgi:hypothetical protein
VAGGARDLDQKSVTLRILKGEQGDEISLAGAVKRIEEVEGRPDILALGIQFTAEPPMSYKLMISGYLSAARKTTAGPAAPAPRGGNATGG